MGIGSWGWLGFEGLGVSVKLMGAGVSGIWLFDIVVVWLFDGVDGSNFNTLWF